jgi:hypothetical protein
MILHDDDARLAHNSVVHPPNRVGNPQYRWRTQEQWRSSARFQPLLDLMIDARAVRSDAWSLLLRGA